MKSLPPLPHRRHSSPAGLLSLCLIVICSICSAADTLSGDPGAFVDGALRRLEASDSVLPSVENGLLPLFEPGLRQMFVKAAEIDKAFSKAHPDEKPPFVEFDPFRPLPDAHETATVKMALPGGPEDDSIVAVEYVYRDGSVEAVQSQFSIMVVFRLARAPGAGFVISDITTFDPRPDVGNRSLKEELSLALRTAAIAD